MKSAYFVDFDEMKAFTFYLKFKNISYTTIEHLQICSKFNVKYTVYEVKFGGET